MGFRGGNLNALLAYRMTCGGHPIDKSAFYRFQTSPVSNRLSRMNARLCWPARDLNQKPRFCMHATISAALDSSTTSYLNAHIYDNKMGCDHLPLKNSVFRSSQTRLVQNHQGMYLDLSRTRKFGLGNMEESSSESGTNTLFSF